MKKFLILMLAVLAVTTQLSASSLELGLNSTSVRGDIDTKNGFGFKIGTVLPSYWNKTPVDVVISLVNRNTKATNYYYYNMNYSRTSIEFEARFKKMLDTGICMYAGPYAGINLRHTFSYYGETEDMSEFFETLDAGLVFGLSFLADNLTYNAGYQIGLLDIADNANVKPNGFAFSVAIPMN